MGQLKHDRYLQDLCAELEPQYDLILTNVPFYSKKKRKVAEVDIIAVRRGYYDIYEVKCNYRIAKARKQLKKVKNLLGTNVKDLFFFCGANRSLTRLDVDAAN